jgi:hypothetical protein
MVILCYVLKHIITNKNKILHKLFHVLFSQIRIKYYINCFMYYFLPTTKKLKRLPNLFSNPYRILYLSFKKIYDEFED